ncbi:hypothetical protein ABMY26_17675 [Azospirillum sp. HJ39]|uniref:hypothetical protein n=1 Tax=Azospirillum sp. HJ39 TaxID=3159496 RepID=UPI00355724EC
MSGRELPAGWVNTVIREAIAPYESIDPTRMPDQPFSYIDIGAIDNKNHNIGEAKKFLGKDAPSRARRIVASGDVLYSTVRPYLKNIAPVGAEFDGFLTSTGIAILRASSAVLPEYLKNWVVSDNFARIVGRSMDGSLYPAVRDADVESAPLPLAPLPEQRRIVEKIEALTARSRLAREALNALPALIDRYRQSILAAAFRGDLSCDGDDERRSMTVGELVAEPTCNGISIRGTDAPPGVPALRLNALTDQGIDFDARRYIPLGEDRAKRIYVRENDFFVSRGNGSLDLVGRGALASNPPEPIVFPDTMIRIRLDQTVVLPEWFAFIWGAPQIRDQIRARVKTTAGIWKISQRDLSSITVDVPNVHVQVGELRKIRQALGAIEKCRVQFDTATSRLATLDQSILAKAFRGELVPQDPNDEPASVLLERIRAERAAAGPAPRRGRRPKAVDAG